MKLKRQLVSALALGAVAAIALTGCASGTSSAGGTTSAKNIKMTFIQGVAGDPFYVTMQCGVEQEAKKLGVTVSTQGPQKFDPTLQKPIVDSVVATKPSAILIAPTDTSAMEAPLKAAANAGIKVALVDTTVNDPSFATTAVSSDNVGGGKAAFDAITKLHPGGGKVLVISTDPGVSTADQRVSGFAKAAKANSSYDYLGVQYSHNDPATAAKLTTAALAKDPDIVGIFAANTFAAQGVATGIRQAGKQNTVKVVGFDAGSDAVTQLKNGTVQALVAQQPALIGKDAVQQAYNALTGKKVTKKIPTGFFTITKDNLTGEGANYVYKTTC
ncbi:ABC transporter substrate-binding protein [Frondihabitans australicus]|uniref:Monosaccharide ABC transporter substrate-binding protein (CUT2 family) n=1 Tax=Frondihabitans australicus TaxID=386892 RepID=A0A495IGP7_9MICO|nr:ABC transporter substrate-binding protein [Frondihabitans australicus]RKR75193.1 monosaccharide ABC transporter substrate-binding protein (CUT2 family) [Frondihabitans australicus]